MSPYYFFDKKPRRAHETSERSIVGYTSRRHKLRIPCSAASVAALFAPLCLLFPQNLAAQSFAGALKVERFLLAVCFPFYGGLIVSCLLITFLPKLYFLSLFHTQEVWVRLLKKDAKKAADCTFLVTDFDLI